MKHRDVACNVSVSDAQWGSRLIELDPKLPLIGGQGEGDIAAITLAVSVQHPEGIIASDRIARLFVQPQGVFVVVLAE